MTITDDLVSAVVASAISEYVLDLARSGHVHWEWSDAEPFCA
ncbi:hypothetical protein ACWGE0_04895 [Lentzea sp. NPDC054927]